VGGALGGDVAFGDRELGEVIVAMLRRNRAWASSVPAAIQRRHTSPFCRR